LTHRGLSLGAALLWDALSRAAKSEIAVYALVVDAKDEQAVSFYRHHGFVAFGGVKRNLILPIAELK
jgi:ribosomal protein S18 acetylase RimI-like enzyme